MAITFGLFCLTQYRHVRVQVAQETTLITKFVDADGKVDFLKAFEQTQYSVHLKSDENGFRQVIQAIDLSESFSPFYEETCRRLGLDPSKIRPKLKYVDPEVHAREYFRSAEYDAEFICKLLEFMDDWVPEDADELDDWDVKTALLNRLAKPWNEKDLPLFGPWITNNSSSLDFYANSLRQKSFEIPFCPFKNSETKIAFEDEESPIFAWHFTNVWHYRAIARGFWARANYYLGKGDIKKAIDDVISCKRLGRHLRNSNAATERALGQSIESISDGIGFASFQGQAISAEELQYFAKEYDSVPPLTAFTHVDYYEKLRTLAYLQKISLDRDFYLTDNDEDETYLYRLGLDWNIVFKEFHKTFAAIRTADPNFPDPKIKNYAQTSFIWNHATQDFDKEHRLPISLHDRFSRAARSKKFAQVIAIKKNPLFMRIDHDAQCIENVRRITLALLQYEKKNETLPPAYTTDKNQKPLHSWRVLVLPFLGHEELFNKLRLEEPWNSKHNSKFANDCPAVYACPLCDKNTGHQTNYSVICGANAPFEASQGKSLRLFGEHSDDMILVAERRLPVDWMTPVQELTQAQADKGLSYIPRLENESFVGSQHNACAHFGLRDGSAVIIFETVTRAMFRNMIRGTNKQFPDLH